MQQVFTQTAFSEMDIDPLVQQGIQDADFNNCTPVQEKILPIVLAGKNIAAQSQTGTGKTAVFLVALFNRLLHTTTAQKGKKQPRA
ncbi:MAG: DEAD/DEAH box helicase, partial [Pseudomonadota bacterium]|nr:DEAD/DEAH box helicase [Pseudomonadota bacterium]